MARGRAAQDRDGKKPAAKKAAGARPKAAPAAGGGMFKLLFYLAILGGVGYAALSIPVQGKTAVEHAREFLDRHPTLGRAEAHKAETARKAEPAKKAEPQKPAKAEPAKAAKEPAKPAPAKVAVVRNGVDLPPGERVSNRERQALDKLLPR